jgi:hypothetical protein
VSPPPLVPSESVGPAPSSFTLALAVDVALSDDGGNWAGAAFSGCATYGPICALFTARGSTSSVRSLHPELPGFRKIVELKRRLGESGSAGQLVYSDGLAAVSVFIEPLDSPRRDPARTGLASVGAIHIYTREVANHMITVVGEAPAASVQRIANAVEYRETNK